MADRRAAWAAGAAIALVLTACTETPAPDPSPTTAIIWEAGHLGTGSPTIHWPGGEPDLGEFTDDPWAQATLTWQVAEAFAGNTGIYSEKAYLGVGYGRDIRLASSSATWDLRRGDPGVFEEKSPGPIPMYILSSEHWYSEEDGVEVGEVYFCAAGNWQVTNADGVLASTDDIEPIIIKSNLSQIGIGHIVVTGSGRTSSWKAPGAETSMHESDCDTSRMRLGYFDPAPDYNHIPELWEIIGWSGQPLYNPDGTETGEH